VSSQYRIEVVALKVIKAREMKIKEATKPDIRVGSKNRFCETAMVLRSVEVASLRTILRKEYLIRD